MNPYPGLRPFDTAEARLFFGRDRQIDELSAVLDGSRSRFVAVVGSSGSGKSSLVRAGLLPALGDRWVAATMRPGDEPVQNLITALAGDHVLGGEESDRDALIAQLQAVLSHSSLGLADVAYHRRLEGRRLLIVVDQFEELFRFDASRTGDDGRVETAAFVQLLIEATRQPDVPIDVVITMRSDFLGDCARYRDLPETINDGLYLVPRMTRSQLRAAITGPAEQAGGSLTPRLVQRMLNDAGSALDADDVGPDPDILPVMQHVLMRTWEAWAADADPRSPMDLEHSQ